MMSCSAAPSGLVTTATRRGKRGQRPLALGREQAVGLELPRVLERLAPQAVALASMRGRRTASRRAPQTPSAGRARPPACPRRAQRACRASRAHTTQRICASASRSVKYQCPLRCALKSLTSPRTHSGANAPSMTSLRRQRERGDRRSPTRGSAQASLGPARREAVARRPVGSRRRAAAGGSYRDRSRGAAQRSSTAARPRSRADVDCRRVMRRAAGRAVRAGRRRFTHPPAARARTVFASSIAIVIGPTPPGTGVMSDATLAHRVEVHVADQARSPLGVRGRRRGSCRRRSRPRPASPCRP